jgi:hypothetical protein
MAVAALKSCLLKLLIVLASKPFVFQEQQKLLLHHPTATTNNTSMDPQLFQSFQQQFVAAQMAAAAAAMASGGNLSAQLSPPTESAASAIDTNSLLPMVSSAFQFPSPFATAMAAASTGMGGGLNSASKFFFPPNFFLSGGGDSSGLLSSFSNNNGVGISLEPQHGSESQQNLAQAQRQSTSPPGGQGKHLKSPSCNGAPSVKKSPSSLQSSATPTATLPRSGGGSHNTSSFFSSPFAIESLTAGMGGGATQLDTAKFLAAAAHHNEMMTNAGSRLSGATKSEEDQEDGHGG